MYSIFFKSRGETVQIPIPRNKTVTAKLYRRLAIMKKFENYVKKSRPRLCLQSLTLLQDNVPAHTLKETLAFLDKKCLTIQYNEIISTSKLSFHNPLLMKYYNALGIFFFRLWKLSF